jgi:nucleotide-binding universal stress UspA family protein
VDIMSLHGPILVALDGSETAERAARLADALATALRSHLALLTVLEDLPGVLPGAEVDLERLGREHFTTYLKDVRTRLGHPEIRTIVRVGHATSEILACADEIGAGVIALTTHGRSGVGRWLHGSTASDLLHRSHVPLLVLGPNISEAPTGNRVSHIMVPLDGSELSETALEVASQLKAATNAKVSLVRAAQWAVQAYPYTLPMQYVPELDAELEKGALAYLDRHRGALGQDVATHVVRGATADSLLDFVDRQKVDLVVMSTHGRSGIARVAIGSTADRLLQGASAVLLLPANQTPSAKPPSSLEDEAIQEVIAHN